MRWNQLKKKIGATEDVGELEMHRKTKLRLRLKIQGTQWSESHNNEVVPSPRLLFWACICNVSWFAKHYRNTKKNTHVSPK